MNTSQRVSALGKFAFGVAAALAAFLPAHAQKFPERPVRILVPLAAGGSVDAGTCCRCPVCALARSLRGSFAAV